MVKKYNLLLSVILIMAMCAATFAGCGWAAATTTENAAGDTADTGDAKETLKDAEAFMQLNPDIKIKVEVPPGMSIGPSSRRRLRAAMFTAGSWYSVELTNIEGLNCDVAPLPKSVQRGSICGVMGYSIAANTKYPEQAWKFVEYMGGYDANVIQAESGAAISAFEGSQEAWVKGFPSINGQVFAGNLASG